MAYIAPAVAQLLVRRQQPLAPTATSPWNAFAASYIQPAEYATYGVSEAAQIEAASRLVDGYLGRPEGLLWMPDADGEPAFMAALTPSRTYTITGAITAGTTALSIPKAQFGLQSVGTVALLDRMGVPEVVAVAGGIGGALTISSVAYDHAAGATLEFGLAISEQSANRDGTLSLRRYPVAKVLSSYGGQADRSGGGMPYYGQSGGWNSFPLGQTDFNASTGVISLTGGAVNPYFGSARVQYVAGWSYATLPRGIKQAVAKLVSDASSLRSEGFSPGIRLLKSGDGTIERFAGSGGQETVIDATIAALLAPYKIYRL